MENGRREMGNGKYKIIEAQRRANLFLIESHVKNNVPTIVCHPFLSRVQWAAGRGT